ncbi:MAG TPA: DUF4232 domain-containing protein [Candidatus Saccharimonadia bacterium]|nr:DUF4232 domain-containing protein [Candidatus Saccharimonadia bacterium]
MAASSKGTARSGRTWPARSVHPVIWLAIIAALVVIGLWYWPARPGWMAAVSPCGPASLKLTPGQQQGAAGTIYQHMILTNVSQQTCTMAGFPTAFLYSGDGYALGGGAAARPQPAPVAITLAPGQTANTVLGYPQAGNFNPGVCTAASVSLKLYPPASTTPLETPLTVPWCPGFSESALQPGN